MTSIRFSRKPYTVTYKDYHTGEIKKIKRRPPPKLHDILPTDKVELTRKKNDDWLEGEEFTVKHINPRHPNILQIEKPEGPATFVSHYDLRLEERIARRPGYNPEEDPQNNKYLLWP